MTLRAKALGLLGAIALAIGIIGPVAAQTDSASIGTSLSVVPGSTFDVEITSAAVNFTQKTFTFGAQNGNQSTLYYQVTDGRGTNSGWSVTMTATALTGTNPNNPNQVLTSFHATPSKADAYGGTNPTPVSVGGVPASAFCTIGVTGGAGWQSLAVGSTASVSSSAAGCGTGKYTHYTSLFIDLPAVTIVDTYASTLTVSLNGAAPS